MIGMTSTRRRDTTAPSLTEKNSKDLSKEHESSLHAFCTYSGHLVGNFSDQSPGMCQARCASLILCSYFSFSMKNRNCTLHGRLAQRSFTEFRGILVEYYVFCNA